MNPESPKSPREELELRLTALLLGELSAAEAAAVRAALAKDPELARLHEDLKATIRLVREATVSSSDAASAQTPPNKLSEERRKILRTHFAIPPLKQSDRKPRPSFPIRLVEVLAVLAIVAVLAAMILPNFVRARTSSQSNAVINNLRQLDGAKQQWALEHDRSENDVPTFQDLKPYFKGDGTPPDVMGERYALGRVGESSTASVGAGSNRKLFNADPGPTVQIANAASSPAKTDPPGGGGFRVNFANRVSPPPLASANPAQSSPPSAQPFYSSNVVGYVNLDAKKAERGDPKPQDGMAYGMRYGGATREHSTLGKPAQADVPTASPPPQPSPIVLPAAPYEDLASRNLFGLKPPPPPVAASPVPAGEPEFSGTLESLQTTRPGTPPPTRQQQIENLGMVRQDYFARIAGASGAQIASATGGENFNGQLWFDGGGSRTGLPSIEQKQVSPAVDLFARVGIGPLSDRKLLTPEPKPSSLDRNSLTLPGTVHLPQGSVALADANHPPASAAPSRTTPIVLPSVANETAGVRLRPYRAVAAHIADESRAAAASVQAGQEPLEATAAIEAGTARPSFAKERDPAHQAIPSPERLQAIADDLNTIAAVAEPLTRPAAVANVATKTAETDDRQTPRQAAPAAPIPQPEIPTSENNFSTFSLNVSDVSFKLAAASLEQGQMPDPASVRSEEFINAFDYRDPEPKWDSASGLSDQAGKMPPPLAFAWERARYPFAHNRDLLRLSLKTAAAGRQAGRPLNLVLLLDNSGSMERADRVQIIREALRVLADQLQPQDKLSVITFARTARLVADGVSGDKAGEVTEQVGGLTPQGGTNLEDAMNLAYQTAAKHYLANGINRVVLLTDGAANLGNVEPESLKQEVEAQRQQGIALDCFGIGWEGFNDDLLEVLSRNGDGRYGFLNSPEEAATDFAGQLAGALKVAASDVKVQVEFNPRRVTSYRQIGYAKHQLTKEQFRDNTVDAAEIAAQKAGNALYTVEVNPAGEGPLATVRVRFKIPGTTDYREHAWDVPFTGNAVSLEQASPAMRLAASASAFSEWLVASPFAGEVTPDALLRYLGGVPEIYGADARPKKLEWMIRQAKSIAGK